MFRLIVICCLALIGLVHSGAAHAELPEPVVTMILEAVKGGKDSEVQSVASVARRTYPQDKDEIDRLVGEHNVRVAEAAERKKQELLAASLLQYWTGQGELGGYRSTGNTRNTGLSGGLKLSRNGVNWKFKFRAQADYQKSNGVTSREQFLVGFSPEYRINDRSFAFGLVQWDRDRFQGFGSRFTLSGGVGYNLVREPELKIDVKAGPAIRYTEYIDDGSDTELSGLLGLEGRWKLSKSVSLNELVEAYVQSGNSTFASTTSLDSKLIGALSARLSYVVEHETNPPVGERKTDTITRATLVYDF